MRYIRTLGVEYGDLRLLHLPQDESLELCYETPSVRFYATYLALVTRLLLSELHPNLQNRIPPGYCGQMSLFLRPDIVFLPPFSLPSGDFISPPCGRSCGRR